MMANPVQEEPGRKVKPWQWAAVSLGAALILACGGVVAAVLPKVLDKGETPDTRPDVITSEPSVSATEGELRRYSTEINIPPPGVTEMTVRVDSGTIHAFTSGPICVVDNTCLPGGEGRGSVLILLPRGTPYQLFGLVPTYNWHGAYYGSPDQWPGLAQERANSMLGPNSCGPGITCNKVDVLVIGPDGTVAQYTRP